jgi:hypothetical protein
LRYANALHTSVGEVMADVAATRNMILEDQEELSSDTADFAGLSFVAFAAF